MISKQFTLSRSRALDWLEEFNGEAPACTVYIAPSSGRQEAEKMLGSVLDRGSFLDELAENASKSPTGAVIFYVSGRAYVVWPPFPVGENANDRCYNPVHLQALLKHDWRMGLVLVRLGHYAIGLFKGEQLVDGKAGTGLVHARHHKGGSSSQRFARHREKQMETFFTRIEGHARELIEPHLREIDYILYGGTRDTLLTMWRQCAFFRQLERKAINRLLSVREPKRSSLDEAIKQAYSSMVYEFEE
ncbi:MAG: Vms1/Ankzf1 family peptidyl-tRNA hydrolase [Dehalococcoidia bacterium]|jgi:peptide subunit release factor 1 (eRF1)